MLTVTPLAIADVLKLQPRILQDERGVFLESFNQSAFKAAGIPTDFAQDNTSVSAQWVLRGLHYQKPPYAQAKLVRCVRGRIWDVAVDIRPESHTYGRWVAEELSADNYTILYIPEGFAHGFVALTPQATLHYKTSREYHASSDAGILWNDPAIGITWPQPPANQAFLLSAKDRELPTLEKAINGFAACPA